MGSARRHRRGTRPMYIYLYTFCSRHMQGARVIYADNGRASWARLISNTCVHAVAAGLFTMGVLKNWFVKDFIFENYA